MKARLVFMTAVCTLLCGCEPEEAPLAPQQPPPPVLPQQPRTYALYGTVRDTAGLAVPGARVEITFGVPFPGLFTVTDESGSFRFEALPGYVRIRVTKPGHEIVDRDVPLDADVGIEIRLPRLDLIPLGKTVHSVTNEPPCSLGEWDSRLFCRRLFLVPPASGTMVVMIRTAGEALDARMFLVGANTDLAYNWGTEFVLSTRVTDEGTYEIRVYSDGVQQEFELHAYLQPEG